MSIKIVINKSFQCVRNSLSNKTLVHTYLCRIHRFIVRGNRSGLSTDRNPFCVWEDSELQRVNVSLFTLTTDSRVLYYTKTIKTLIGNLLFVQTIMFMSSTNDILSSCSFLFSLVYSSKLTIGDYWGSVYRRVRKHTHIKNQLTITNKGKCLAIEINDIITLVVK